MSLCEAQERISAPEFALWKAEFALDPWGDARADWRSALLAHAVAVFSGHAADGVVAEDFLLRFADPNQQEVKPRQTPEQQRAMFRAIGEQMAGK